VGSGVLSLGVKPPVCEADHSSPSNAEVKNAWNYTSTPPYVFMVWCLIKHRMCLHLVKLRDNFTFTFSGIITIPIRCAPSKALSKLLYFSHKFLQLMKIWKDPTWWTT
jgi:hypothetical protein